MLRLRSLVSPSSKSCSVNKWVKVRLQKLFQISFWVSVQNLLDNVRKGTWKVFAGIMILEDFPAVSGTWTILHFHILSLSFVFVSIYKDKYIFSILSVSYLCTYSTLSNLLLMKGSWLVGGVFCEGILGVRLLAGPLIPCWVRVGEIRSSVWG